MRPVSLMPAVLAALLLALPAPAQVPPPLPSVDLGIRELIFRPEVVSSRTPEDVWLLANGRGSANQVLRSADAGRSWQLDATASWALRKSLLAGSSITLDTLVWFTPEIGIAAGSIGARVLRTTDAGLSWQSIPLTDDLYVYAVERVGERAWLCGSSGKLFRSDDAGASWHELKDSPFNRDDRCMDMSFLSPESGWAVGMNGSVWATEDGGTSWQHVPFEQPLKYLRRVVRLTPQAAWVGGHRERYLTTDAGKTWHARPWTEDELNTPLAAARTPDGRHLITVGPVGEGVPVEQWVPFLGEAEHATSPGGDTVVALVVADQREMRLALSVSGQLVRKGPPVSQGSGVLTPLEGLVRKSPETWLGWAGEQLAASHDEGRTWFQLGRVPQTPIRALAFLKEDTVLAELGTGELLRSKDFGRLWEPSTSPLDAYDFAVASGRTASPETPFDCVLTTAPASMKLHLDNLGCFHQVEGQLSVKLSSDGAELSGKSLDNKPVKLGSKKLSRAEGERIVRELVAAATRQETPLGCDSTTKYTAILEWSCPSGHVKEGTVRFRAPGCGALTYGSATTWGSNAPGSYARALGLHQAASEEFKSASH
ncbi:YCF48-related protein [Archangium lansingense]|uniref:YCF48-related protein n=1 Tax=Archangium lansingense TaxID=2995310 RepID=A0ABT4ALY4_9BACT|nr:YCF48-related protein [Archangium lansinium]MCY1082711.1 YCF48-related protein [Archangium lansinium]